MAGSPFGTKRNFNYSTYGGCDIQASIGGKVVFNLQAISYAVTREKAPIYTLGSATPRAFGRGKRGIAGSMILTQFDQHGYMEIWNDSRFAADNTENSPWGKDGAPSPNFDPANYSAVSAADAINANPQGQNEGTDWNNAPTAKRPWYSDQMLPFDITVYGANEYGSTSVMRIYGTEILNEGWGISVDDMVSEMQATWVALAVHPWVRVPNTFNEEGGDNSLGTGLGLSSD